MCVNILVLAGNGIGPEITAATLNVLRTADKVLGLNLAFEEMPIGLTALASSGSTCPPALLDRIPQVDGVILGPVSTYDYPPRGQGGINPSAEVRTRFELGANIRPCRSRPGLSILRQPMDLIIVRECGPVGVRSVERQERRAGQSDNPHHQGAQQERVRPRPLPLIFPRS